MRFSKWHGLGNDFVIVNTLEEPIIREQELAKSVCDRHFGIGADGLVLIGPSDTADYQMRIVNSDGSYAEMCGNATRCVARYLYEHNMVTNKAITLETGAGIVRPLLLGDGTGAVKVNMGRARLLRGEIPMTGDPATTAVDIPIEVGGAKLRGTAVSMGNPHFVIFVDDVSAVDISTVGAQVEALPLFPRKTNVEFVQRLSASRVRMRVWERGCGITLACGTGSCATGVAGVLTGRTQREISVVLDGGELTIEYAEDGAVYMTGPAVCVFTGNWN